MLDFMMANRNPRRYCRFQNCESTDLDQLHMYRFPRDEKRCKLWVDACSNEKLEGIPAAKLYTKAYLCEKHFSDWCFSNRKTRERLVHNAVPECLTASRARELLNPPTSIDTVVNIKKELDINEYNCNASKKTPSKMLNFMMSNRSPKRYCRFQNCESTDLDKLHMYRFPRDEKRCKLWVDAGSNEKLKGMSAEKLYINAQLCEKHFSDWCFSNRKTKERLVHNAVPECPTASRARELLNAPTSTDTVVNIEKEQDINEVDDNTSLKMLYLMMSNKRPKRYCRFQNCKTTDLDKLHMYRFPLDRKRCKLWVSACCNEKLEGIPAEKLYTKAYLCEKHFRDWCFSNRKTKQHLVHDAVPECLTASKARELLNPPIYMDTFVYIKEEHDIDE